MRGFWIAAGSMTALGLIALAAFVFLVERADSERAERREQAEATALVASAPGRIDRARALLADESLVDREDLSIIRRADAELAVLRGITPPPAGFEEVDANLDRLSRLVHGRIADRELTTAEDLAESNSWTEVQLAIARSRVFVQAHGGPELAGRLAAVEARAEPFAAAVRVISTGRLALDAEHPNALAAEAAYDSALEQLAGLSEDVRDAMSSEIAPLERSLRTKRSRNERAVRRLEAEIAHLAARMEQCGASPSVSAWDGELVGAESFVARTAHDPSSIEVGNCTTPQLSTARHQCWLSTCDVRGTNAFGARVLNRVRFEVRHDEIVASR